MTTEELDAIRQRAEAATKTIIPGGLNYGSDVQDQYSARHRICCDDIPKLLDEIERLWTRIPPIDPETSVHG